MAPPFLVEFREEEAVEADTRNLKIWLLEVGESANFKFAGSEIGKGVKLLFLSFKADDLLKIS